VFSIRANAVRKPNRHLAVALLSSQGRTAVLAADSTLVKEFIVPPNSVPGRDISYCQGNVKIMSMAQMIALAQYFKNG
jgi:hypothetical protein